MSILDGARVLVTGGTGSFGNAFVKYVLAHHSPSALIIFSRDELKQAEMRQRFGDHHALKFFLGDVRDLSRLRMALKGVHVVVHAAAMKRVDACEFNPFEAVQTNIIGTQNVIQAALDWGVLKVLALSSDKACSPLNLYGKSKACLEDMIRAANAYSGGNVPAFSALRYGNVGGSRGSVIPLWREAAKRGETLEVNDPEATRFWFTLDGAVRFALWALEEMRGGELFVPKLPSFRVVDLAHAIAIEANADRLALKVTAPRPGDKRHESMVSADEAPYFRDTGAHYVRGTGEGQELPDGFSYSSDNNDDWLTPDSLVRALRSV